MSYTSASRSFSCSGLGPPRRDVKAIERQASRVVFRVGNLIVGETANAVLGREQRDEFDARRVVQHVDRLPSFTITTSVVGDQSETQTREWLKVVALEYVDARQYFRRAVNFIAKRELLETATN